MEEQLHTLQKFRLLEKLTIYLGEEDPSQEKIRYNPSAVNEYPVNSEQMVMENPDNRTVAQVVDEKNF